MTTSAPTSLMPIGAFSSATQLSAKALRLYAEHGILLPARIDAETGYRYYRVDQVQEARLVRLLRELDMPLATIGAVLATPSTIDAQLKLHMDAVSRKYVQQQTAYRAALTLLSTAMAKVTDRIAERSQPALHAIAIPFEANSDTLIARSHALLNQALRDIEPHRLIKQNAFIQLSAPLTAHDDIAVELCIPVSGDEDFPSPYVTRHWHALVMASTEVAIQNDPVDFIGASDALFDWFDRNGKTLAQAPLIFIHDHAMELAWPIS